MRGRSLLGLLLVSAFAGCLGGADDDAPTGPLDGVGDGPAALRLTTPLALTTGTHGGFEPSIEVGPDGTVYVTAATSGRPGNLDAGPARLASWLWYSPDGGATWHDLPSPAQAHEAMLGLEGDITVDGQGRLYFVDTYLEDNTLSRWSPPPRPGAAPAWDFSRPIQGTASISDDRPWLTAHGDGVVYLTSNNGAAPPAPENLQDGEVAPASIWLHRSLDGGVTWSLGHGFADETFCMPAADPTDDHDVLVVCHRDGDAPLLSAYLSTDQGRTWVRPFQAQYAHGPAFLLPGAAIDRAGTRYAAWIDDDAPITGVQDPVWQGSEPGRIHLARAPDETARAWTGPLDITPFAGRFGMLHVAAGSPGTVAVVFYATTDLAPGDDTEWTPHLLLSHDADRQDATWINVPLLETPATVGPVPPRDFFQVAVGPDDAIHVITQQDRLDAPPLPGDGIRADLLYVRTVPAASRPAD